MLTSKKQCVRIPFADALTDKEINAKQYRTLITEQWNNPEIFFKISLRDEELDSFLFIRKKRFEVNHKEPYQKWYNLKNSKRL